MMRHFFWQRALGVSLVILDLIHALALTAPVV
jgi:hypothetical protein